VLTPWAAPRFNIGPVTFLYIDDITTSEFYPAGPTPDVLAKHSFDTLLELMRETHASWLAGVAVEGCEQQRAEEIGELAVDLAIVALQLAAPHLDTRSMCRLDSRRGSAQKRVISEANCYYTGSWSRKEPGLAIGTGTLADILHKTTPVITAVGNVVRGFWSEVQRVYEKRICTSLPSSLRIAWNGVLKPRHFLGVRLAVRTMSWISSSDTLSMSM
jgi:hypothetical protein